MTHAWQQVILATVVACLCAAGSANNDHRKTKYSAIFPLAVNTYQMPDHCGVLAVFLESGNLFDKLERRGTTHGVEFRTGDQPVQEFPDSISVRIEALPLHCPPPPVPPLLGGVPGEAPTVAETDVMDGWKFTVAWVHPGQTNKIDNIGVLKTGADEVVFAETDCAPWTY